MSDATSLPRADGAIAFADPRRIGEAVAACLAGSWRATPPTPPPAETLILALPVLEAGRAAALARAPATDASGDTRDLLRQHRLTQAVTAMRQDAFLVDVGRALDAAGVPYLLFKGRAIARHYAEPALRPHGDLDILIPRARAGDARAVFDALGRAGAGTGKPFTAGSFSVATRPGIGGIVDLHFDLAKYGVADPLEALAGARRVDIGGHPVPILGEEDHFRLVCLHFLRHGGCRALWLCDIAAMMETLPDGFDWRHCHRDDPLLVNWLGACAGLAREILGADRGRLPEEIRSAGAPAWVVETVLRAIGVSMALQHPTNRMRVSLREGPVPAFRALAARWPNPVASVQGLGLRYGPARLVPLQAALFLRRAARYCLSPLTNGLDRLVRNKSRLPNGDH